MSKYVTCPDCGANLDPGEQCDCKHNTVDNGAASNVFVRTNTEMHSQSRALLGRAQTHMRTA
jgi:hypothetical protein